MKQAWDRDRITATLKRLHKAGEDLSYNRLVKKKQALVSAAAYYFGSFRKAVEAAGIDYAQVRQRPRWSKAAIVRLIKQAKREGRELYWSSVTRPGSKLATAAFAALQRRLFGSWEGALRAAGLDAKQVSRYRIWNRKSIVVALKRCLREGRRINSGAVQQHDLGLYAAALRHFGSYDEALRAAGLEPLELRQRRRWSKEDVVKELRAFKRKAGSIRDGELKSRAPALYGAAVRRFKTLAAAREAAG